MDKKQILVCPLDWGLGHASRVSRIIQVLIERGHKVIIAGSGLSLKFLQSEFPELRVLPLYGAKIKYNRKFSAWFMIVIFIPVWIINILRDHFTLKKIIKHYQIDLTISDARYGLWNKTIPSILITHQLRIKLPVYNVFLDKVIIKINRMAIRRFTWCWVPDYPDFPCLGGKLSHIPELPANARFIGLLSRFNTPEKKQVNKYLYELVAVISGPEPQRSVFEKLLVKQFADFKNKSLIVVGRPGKFEEKAISENCKTVSFLSGQKLSDVLTQTRYIICRSGYSSIMDLVALQKPAFLVPTPGQTEQEYLAKYLSEKQMFPFCRQKDFNLQKALTIMDHFQYRHIEPGPDLLNEAISDLEKIKNQ